MEKLICIIPFVLFSFYLEGLKSSIGSCRGCDFLKPMNWYPQILIQPTNYWQNYPTTQRVLGFECPLNKRQLTGMLVNIASCKPSPCFNSEFGRSACWVPFDIYMENAMDGKQLLIKSAVDVLAGYSLQEYTLKFFQINFNCVCALVRAHRHKSHLK